MTKTKWGVFILSWLVGLAIYGNSVTEETMASEFAKIDEKPDTNKVVVTSVKTCFGDECGTWESNLPIPEVIYELTGKHNGWEQIARRIIKVWGKDAYIGLRIAHCESRFGKDSFNQNTNGTTDHGVFQINSFWTKHYGNEFKTNWETNIEVAHDIYTKYGAKQWVCVKLYSEGWE